MIELTIKSIRNKYTYTLKDNKDNIYEFNLDFFGIDEFPKENDKISISAELLNPRYSGYSSFYTFGSLKDKSGKEQSLLNEIDKIKVFINNKEILLKRLYG